MREGYPGVASEEARKKSAKAQEFLNSKARMNGLKPVAETPKEPGVHKISEEDVMNEEEIQNILNDGRDDAGDIETEERKAA